MNNRIPGTTGQKNWRNGKGMFRIININCYHNRVAIRSFIGFISVSTGTPGKFMTLLILRRQLKFQNRRMHLTNIAENKKFFYLCPFSLVEFFADFFFQ